jgi:CO dehydrogenase maturation factor
VPVSDMKELIEERTEAKDAANGIGSYFKLNPTVNDLPDKLSTEHNGVRLMVMGTVKKAAAAASAPHPPCSKRS